MNGYSGTTCQTAPEECPTTNTSLEGCEEYESCSSAEGTFYTCTECSKGYALQENGSCLDMCSDYPEMGECPENANCSRCSYDNDLYRLDGCKSNYTWMDNECVPNSLISADIKGATIGSTASYATSDNAAEDIEVIVDPNRVAKSATTKYKIYGLYGGQYLSKGGSTSVTIVNYSPSISDIYGVQNGNASSDGEWGGSGSIFINNGRYSEYSPDLTTNIIGAGGVNATGDGSDGMITIINDSSGFVKGSVGNNATDGAYGTIDITNTGNGAVLGTGGWNSSANPTKGVSSQGTINIVNTGTGSVTGSGSYNVLNGSGQIRISNSGEGGSGTVIGATGYNVTETRDPDEGYDSSAEIIIENTGNGNVTGATSYNAKGASNGNITITNNGDGAVTGAGGNNVENGATGKIEITNMGTGAVIGAKGYNAKDAEAEGTIKINNTGDGNVTGATSTNAYNGIGSIDITNEGGGNVLGAANNAYLSLNTESLLRGDIVINNVGDGDVTGVSGYNTSGDKVEGQISIINTGNGSVLGSGGANASAGGKWANIEIQNTGNGTVIGAKKYNYYRSSVYDDSEQHIYPEAFIDIKNIGHGNVTGLAYNTSAINAYNGKGTIMIANDGFGTVIGSESQNAVNGDGTININDGIGNDEEENPELGSVYGIKVKSGTGINTKSTGDMAISGLIEVRTDLKDIYGMHDSAQGKLQNLYLTQSAGEEYDSPTTAEIRVTRTDNEIDGAAYGMYTSGTSGTADTNLNFYYSASSDTVPGGAAWIDVSGKNAYGMYSNSPVSNLYINGTTIPDEAVEAHIAVSGNDTAYGIYGTGGITTLRWTGSDNPENEVRVLSDIFVSSFGDAYGIYKSGTGTLNTSGLLQYNGDYADRIYASGYKNVAGIYSEGGTVNSRGYIDVTQSSSDSDQNGDVFGISGANTTVNHFGEMSVSGEDTNSISGILGKTVKNSGTINIDQTGDGAVYGLRGDGSTSTVTNEGNINITHSGDGYVYGLKGYTVTNEETGVITINRTGAAKPIGGVVYGMYIDQNGTGRNKGIINISNARKGYGIYGEAGSKLYNTGTISVSAIEPYGINLNGTVQPDQGTINLTELGCPVGTVEVGGYCVRIGVNANTSKEYALANKTKTSDAIEVVDNTTDDINAIYGIRYNSVSNDVFNANGTGATAAKNIKGTINITNTNPNVSTVYGMYRPYMNHPTKLLNAYGYATGEINIQNTGDSNIYGISGGYGGNGIGAGATGTLVIQNIGDGDVTGIAGIYNAVMNAHGTVDITNIGHGNVIGQHGLRNGCGAGEGLIRIDNTGSGNIIGQLGHFNACKR